MVDSAPWVEEVCAAVAAFARVVADDAVAHVGAAIAGGASASHAADLALAFSVARGDPAAARRFDELVAPAVVAAVRSIDGEPSFVDEVCQQARVRLVVGDSTTPARIASYRGTGPLRAWVAIAAQRLALNAKRDAPAARTAAPPDVLAELVDREPDPELRHLKTLYRAEFRDALVGALGELPDRGRAVLRLRFVEGLELQQIGRLYRVHESTASRWIAGALAQIATAARARLIARLAVTAATADSVVRMVQSQLDLSIARLLQ